MDSPDDSQDEDLESAHAQRKEHAEADEIFFDEESEEESALENDTVMAVHIVDTKHEDGIMKDTLQQFKIPMVDQAWFASIMGCVVLANTVLIGMELEMGENAPMAFMIANNTFLLVYLTELAIRFLTFGADALRDTLTCLDITLVLLSFIERFASGGSMARSLPSIRLLRLLRLVRTFRFIMKSKDVLILLSGINKAMTCLFWVVLGLVFLLWIAAAATRQILGNSPAWNEYKDPMKEVEAFHRFDVSEYFGTQLRAFLTMLQVATNSQWANHIGRPIILQYPVLAIFLFFYLLITTYGILMLVISNIVQDSIEANVAFEKAVGEVDREHRKLAGVRAKRLLQAIDEDGDGELELHELGEALQHKELLKIMRELEVPILHPEGLMLMFDQDGSGTVSFTELVDGITSMLEDITDRDFTKLGLWGESLKMRVDRLDARCIRLQRLVTTVRQELSASFDALKHFIEERASTELYYRALKQIRNAPPPVPPTLAEALNVEIKPTLPYDEAGAFLNLAKRYINPNLRPSVPRPPPGSVLEAARVPEVAPEFTDLKRTLVNRKAVLGDAPPRLAVAQARRQEQDADIQKSDQRLTIQTEDGYRPALCLKEIKELLL